MKRNELTAKDFDWVKWSPSVIKKIAAQALEYKKASYKKVKEILPENRTYENTVYALEVADGEYGDKMRQIGILSEVSPKKEIREVIHQVFLDLSNKLVDLEHDPDLYVAVQEYNEGNFRDEKKKLAKDDIKLLVDSLREYRRAGFDLPLATQKKLKALLKKMSKPSNDFRKNINDYTDYITLSKDELGGLSERFINSLPMEKGKYMISLAYPHIFPFLSQSTNREARKKLAEKNLSKGGAKNLKIIESLVDLRKQVAEILGYKHHGDYRTENRMAKSAKTVNEFQDALLKKLLPGTKKELDALKAHARELGIKKLQHYDVSYVGTSLKKKLFDLDPETLRAYFPLDHVIKEMFSLVHDIFGITIKEVTLPLWYKDVRSFEVTNTSDKSLIGYFAMDLFPREGKYGHAMCSDVVVSRELGFKSGKRNTPFTVVVCNFPEPQTKGSGKNKKTIPSLLSLDEVETLFHEFGHCLHMTLSNARHEDQSGANVAWDFVETPSQIMENWVWHESMLKVLSKHFETGKSLDTKTIKQVVASKKFQNAYHFTRQILMSKLDMDLHTGKVKDAKKAYRDMYKKYFGLVLPEKETLFPAGFGHLVGYDAGYYSYLWALVYACDAFSEFEKKGLRSKEVGMRWRKEVLEKGGTEDEIKLVKNFLKRAPSQKAFLKEVGL